MSRIRGRRTAHGVTATAPQTCALCDGPIAVGDRIAPTRRGYAHARCIEQEHE